MDELIKIAESYLFVKGTAEKIAEDPKWAKAGKIHDWRNYIPNAIKELWPKLSLETKLVAMILAEQQANFEEWG